MGSCRDASCQMASNNTKLAPSAKTRRGAKATDSQCCVSCIPGRQIIRNSVTWVPVLLRDTTMTGRWTWNWMKENTHEFRV